jgi:hypothetical protein
MTTLLVTQMNEISAHSGYIFYRVSYLRLARFSKTMSQSAAADTLNYISNQVNIYDYGVILVLGIFGNTLNIIMFSTKLKNSVCTFYLLVSDICNMASILAYILPSIVQLTYGKNGTESSVLWCKLTNYICDTCILISTYTFCLASVDRYFCTSSQPNRRQWSSMKIAKVSIVGTSLLSLPLAIPDLIYWYINSNHKVCTVGETYWLYVSYFLVPVMFAIIPLVILSVFGYKTYRNLQTPVHPTRPAASHVHRRRIDSELAQMVVVQIICFLFQTVTFFIINLYITITLHWEKNDMQLTIQNLFTSIAFTIYNTYLCVNFYVYYLKSPTFRTGIKKILMIKRMRNDIGTGTN